MAYIPPDNLAYPLLVQFNTGSTGSAFFLNHGSLNYLVTAKHVLLNKSGASRGSIFKLSCPAKLESEMTSVFEVTTSEIRVLVHETADVAVVPFGVRTPIEGGKSYNVAVNPGIRVIQAAASGTVSVSSENCVRGLANAFVGNEVLMYGYPTSLGLKQTPQFDYSRPLVRKGGLAGVYPTKGTLILDCPAFPGNSGGPVVQVEEIGNGMKKHSVVGVVSEFIPLAQPRFSPFTGKQVEPELINSGFSVAVAIDNVIDLIERDLATQSQMPLDRGEIMRQHLEGKDKVKTSVLG